MIMLLVGTSPANFSRIRACGGVLFLSQDTVIIYGNSWTGNNVSFWTLKCGRNNVEYELNCTTASIDLIANKVQFVKDATRNKQKIKDILLKLQANKHISIYHKGKLKNATTLEIDFTNMNPATEYTALDNKYVHIKDHKELCVVATIRRWQHAKNKEISLSEWSKVLDVSVPTVLDIFSRMVDKGLLYVKSGDYYRNETGEFRQENNRYYLVDGDSVGQAEQAQQEDEPTVDSPTTVEDKQTDPLDHADDMPDISPVLAAQAEQERATDQPGEQSFFVLNGEPHSVQEILQRLNHTDRNVKVYMTQVDYVWYQLNKQFLDKKTANLVEAKIRGMKNSKSDYPRQQLAEWQEAYKKYHGQIALKQIRELAEQQPVLVFNDGSYTTDLDNLAIDFDQVKELYYLHDGKVSSTTFNKRVENEYGDFPVRMTEKEIAEQIPKYRQLYQQQEAV